MERREIISEEGGFFHEDKNEYFMLNPQVLLLIYCVGWKALNYKDFGTGRCYTKITRL
jgi:hypothetical protein